MTSVLQKSNEEIALKMLNMFEESNLNDEEIEEIMEEILELRNLKKFKVGDVVKINVSSMEELKSKFDEFNSKNVGGFITYVPCDGMSEMLENAKNISNNSCYYNIVKVNGSMNEEGLIGLKPPESFKGTRAWQGGCWFFPSTCLEKI